MRPVWIEIESLVLDGIPLDPARGRRLSALTQAALERLLRLHGIAGPDPAPDSERARRPAPPGKIEAPGGADEFLVGRDDRPRASPDIGSDGLKWH